MTQKHSTQLTRRERDLVRHQAEAMDAAERLLVKLPYSSITVQAIAEEAEFSVGYLYKLFPSKDELYLSLVEARKSEIFQLVKKVEKDESTFEESLKTLVGGILDWFQAHQGFVRDNRSELMVLFKRHHKSVEAIAKKDAEMRRPLLALFQKGIDEGQVNGTSADLMARTLRTLLWGTMSDDIHHDAEGESLNADQIVQIILRTYSPHWKEHE